MIEKLIWLVGCHSLDIVSNLQLVDVAYVMVCGL
jgi:hypothetical protein